jgi:CRP-like cAMP-binding protein
VGEGVSVLRRPYVPVPGQDDEGHTLPTASPRMVGGPGNPTTPISERSLPAVPATPAVPARPSGPAPAGRASAPGPRGAPGAPATPGAEPGAFDETTRLADPFELASRGGPPPEVPGLDFILDGDDGAEPAAAAGDDDDRATRVASDPSQLKTRGGALADTARALAPRDPRPTPSGLDDDTATSVAAPPGGTRPSRSDLSATDVGDAPLGVGVGDDDDGLLVEDTQDRSPGARALPAELLPFSRDDRLLDVEWPRVITGSGPADGDGFDEGAVTNPGAGHPSRPARRPGGGVSTSGDAADAADAAAEAAGRAAADSEPAPKKRITVSRVKSAPDGPETRDDLATQKVERLEPAPLGEPSDGLALASAFEQSFAPASELAPDGSPIERPMPLFSRLGADALRDLRRRMSFRRCAAGDLILREGDPGDACYVVHAGSVRVLKRDPSGSTVDVIEIARLGPGALFGEFAVLADRRRHASVQALEACELYEIPRRLLRELAAEYADVGPALERFFRERLLATLMATAPFFQPLPEEERARLMLRFRPRRITAGESILVEGAPGGGLYLIVLGTVDITRRVDGRRQVLLASLGEGAYFGEMSLLSGGMASATVTAAGSVELAQLTPKDFYDVVAQHPNIWDELRREAARRDLVNQNILAGETAVV